MFWSLRNVDEPDAVGVLCFTEFSHDPTDDETVELFSTLLGFKGAQMSSLGPLRSVSAKGTTVAFRDFVVVGNESLKSVRAYVWGRRLFFSYQVRARNPALSPARDYFDSLPHFAPFRSGFRLLDDVPGEHARAR